MAETSLHRAAGSRASGHERLSFRCIVPWMHAKALCFHALTCVQNLLFARRWSTPGSPSESTCWAVGFPSDSPGLAKDSRKLATCRRAARCRWAVRYWCSTEESFAELLELLSTEARDLRNSAVPVRARGCPFRHSPQFFAFRKFR